MPWNFDVCIVDFMLQMKVDLHHCIAIKIT